MKTIYEKTHFGMDKKPKRLRISVNTPTRDAQYGTVKEGSIVLSILSKDNSQGFSLSTGDLSDILYVLSGARDDLLRRILAMYDQKEANEKICRR